MRLVSKLVLAAFILIGTNTAYAQSGKFCDPTWCRTLDRMERAQWGKLLVDAVNALGLSPRYRLKPRRIEPAIPWLRTKRKKISRKVLADACPAMAPGFKDGSFPYPLKFLGVFDLPKKKNKKERTRPWLRVQVLILPGPAGIPDLDKDKYSEVRTKGDGYLIWEKSWAIGSAKLRPDLNIDVTIVVGKMKTGTQTAPDGSNPRDQVAEPKSITIKLYGPRKIVDTIVKRTDLKKLQRLLER